MPPTLHLERFTVVANRSERLIRGFLSKKTTPRDPYETTVTVKSL